MGEAARAYPNLKPFQPGQSGNPNGRPKATAQLAQAVRKLATPDELAAWYHAVWTGNEEEAGFRPTPAQKFEAGQWLSVRGYGQPVAFKDQEDGDALGLDDAPDRLARRLEAVAQKPQQPGES